MEPILDAPAPPYFLPRARSVGRKGGRRGGVVPWGSCRPRPPVPTPPSPASPGRGKRILGLSSDGLSCAQAGRLKRPGRNQRKYPAKGVVSGNPVLQRQGVRNHASWKSPDSAMPVQSSALTHTAHRAIDKISDKPRFLFFVLRRGSGIYLRYDSGDSNMGILLLGKIPTIRINLPENETIARLP